MFSREFRTGRHLTDPRPMWFYITQVQSGGPVPEEELVSLLQQGAIKATDKIRKHHTNDWQYVGDSSFADLVRPAQHSVRLSDPRLQWWYTVQGKLGGLATEEELEAMIESGKLTANDKIRADHTIYWFYLKETKFAGLLGVEKVAPERRQSLPFIIGGAAVSLVGLGLVPVTAIGFLGVSVGLFLATLGLNWRRGTELG